MNKNVTVKQFLSNLNTNLSDMDAKEMMEFSYFENNDKHYELVYGANAATISENTVIVNIEEFKPFKI